MQLIGFLDLILLSGKDAAETYLKIAECHEKLDVKHEAASALVDAANAYKKVDEERAFSPHRADLHCFDSYFSCNNAPA